MKNATVTVRDCQEKVLWTGKTDGQGIARINDRCLRIEPSPLRLQIGLIRFSSDGRSSLPFGKVFSSQPTPPNDMAFVHSSWDEGIEPWRFQLPSESVFGSRSSAIPFSIGSLLRAGETVHMKHILRQHMMKGLLLAPRISAAHSCLDQALRQRTRNMNFL